MRRKKKKFFHVKNVLHNNRTAGEYEKFAYSLESDCYGLAVHKNNEKKHTIQQSTFGRRI